MYQLNSKYYYIRILKEGGAVTSEEAELMLVPSDRPFLRYMLENQPMRFNRMGNSGPQPDPTYDKSSIPEDREGDIKI